MLSPVTQTAQTWALVSATLGAVIITFIGTSYQQHRQAKGEAEIRREETAREASLRLEGNVAELLSASQDLMIGIQAIRQAYARRTLPMFYLRTLGDLLLALPEVTNVRTFGERDTIKELLRNDAVARP
jgi:hypothetical protein